MDPAIIALIIFVVFVAVCIWDKLPMATTAIAACALMVIFGAAKFSTAFGQFAASSMVLLLGIMVVGAEKCGRRKSKGSISGPTVLRYPATTIRRSRDPTARK